MRHTLLLSTILSVLTASQSISDACTTFVDTLSLENTTILAAERITGGRTISTPGSCHSTAFVTADACRVYAVVKTTAESAVHFEMWLPDVWFGRFLSVGNGGLAGCIDYENLDYGNTLHFATIGSDNGHDGPSGAAFLNQPEVINDFAFRAIHVQAVLGKQIVNGYYNRTHDKSYFIGCSTGGRQGLQSALLYPDDFDGILSGAPAVDFNRLVGWLGTLGHALGAPNPSTSDSFIPASTWPIVSEEIWNQCDGLDGVKDGILTEPDDCAFNPMTLLCDTTASNTEMRFPRHDPDADGDLNLEVVKCDSFDNSSVEGIGFEDITNSQRTSGWIRNESVCRDDGTQNQVEPRGQSDQVLLGDARSGMVDTSRCLTLPQVDALTKIYQPLLGTGGQLLYPRFDPGAEAYGNFNPILSGDIFPIVRDWFRFAIYNDSNYMFDNFGPADVEFAESINPGGISTWNGDLSAFRDLGGKIIVYHGRDDQYIPSGNSKRLYHLISSALSPRSIDDFYRLFLVPGLDHCAKGRGAWAIGQHGVVSNAVNDSAHNILLSLAEWVEVGRAPDVIVGTTLVENLRSDVMQEKRIHCRYPQRSVFNGTVFVCEG